MGFFFLSIFYYFNFLEKAKEIIVLLNKVLNPILVKNIPLLVKF